MKIQNFGIIKLILTLMLVFSYSISFFLIYYFINQNNLIKLILEAFIPILLNYFLICKFMEKIKKIISKVIFKNSYKELEKIFPNIQEKDKKFVMQTFFSLFFNLNLIYIVFLIVFNNKKYINSGGTINENMINLIIFVLNFYLSFNLIFIKLEESYDSRFKI